MSWWWWQSNRKDWKRTAAFPSLTLLKCVNHMPCLLQQNVPAKAYWLNSFTLNIKLWSKRIIFMCEYTHRQFGKWDILSYTAAAAAARPQHFSSSGPLLRGWTFFLEHNKKGKGTWGRWEMEPSSALNIFRYNIKVDICCSLSTLSLSLSLFLVLIQHILRDWNFWVPSTAAVAAKADLTYNKNV